MGAALAEIVDSMKKTRAALRITTDTQMDLDWIKIP
jgi:hypothetical protein